MSSRYEWLEAKNEPSDLLVQGDFVPSYDEPVTAPLALVFGAENGTVLEGTVDELLAMLTRARALVLAQKWLDPTGIEQ